MRLTETVGIMNSKSEKSTVKPLICIYLHNINALLTSPQNSATPGEDKNMSAIFGCEEEWEKDLSILSDEASVISETKMSSTTSESFLSATSFVSTPRS